MSKNIHRERMRMAVCVAMSMVLAAVVPSGVKADDEFGYTLSPDTTSALDSPVVCVTGEFSTSPSGAAVYTVPIDLPIGGSGFRPSLSIIYNSQAGNDVAGYGTAVSGLSVITRAPRDIYHNGEPRGLSYLADDDYLLDGERMVRVSGTPGVEGAVYCLESDPYTRIYAHGTYSSSAGDTWFEAHTSDGMTYEYGHNTTSRQFYTPSSGVTHINAWYVSGSIDASGNAASYNYTTSAGWIYLSWVSYGGLGTAGPHPCTVSFSYENRPDIQEYVVEGVRLRLMNRLSSIYVSVQGAAYRTYSLAYEQGGGVSKLSSVTMSNHLGEISRPLCLTWSADPSAGTDVMKACSQLTVNSFELGDYSDDALMAIDMSGDGLDDLVHVATYKEYEGTSYSPVRYVDIYTAVKNGEETVFSPPLRIPWFGENTEGAVICQSGYYSGCDYDGDGRADMACAFISGNTSTIGLQPMVLLGTVLQEPSYTSAVIDLGLTTLSGDEGIAGYTLADVNGNGTTDLLFLEKGEINGSYKLLVYDSKVTAVSSPARMSLPMPSKPSGIHAGDFNGDGLPDILVLYNGGYRIFWNNGGALSQYGPFSSLKYTSGTLFNSADVLRMGDFNGDGLPDFLVIRGTNTQRWYFEISDGKGGFTQSLATSFSGGNFCTNIKYRDFHVLDFDSDGKSDVVVNWYVRKDSSHDHTKTEWLRSTGSALVSLCSATSARREDSYAWRMLTGDFTGGGCRELMNYGHDCLHAVEADSVPKLRLYRSPVPDAGLLKVTSALNGFGLRDSVRYASLAGGGVYTRGSGAVYPVCDITPPLHVVAVSVRGGDGLSDVTTSYTYSGMRFHLQGRGSMGFSMTGTSSPQTGVSMATTVTEWDVTRHIPSKTLTTSVAGGFRSSTATEYSSAYVTGKSYLTYPQTVRDSDVYGNVAITVRTYDLAKGVLLSERTDHGQNMYRLSEYSGHVSRGVRWLPTRVTTKWRHPDDTSVWTDSTSYAYDSAGHVTTEILHCGTPLALTVSRGYDTHGNVTCVSRQGINASEPSMLTEYESSGRFPVRKSTSPSSTVMTYGYDSRGNLLTETDATNPSQQLVTSHTYDGWGRITSTREPWGSLERVTRGWGTTGQRRSFTLSRRRGAPWVKTWYDALGRKTCVETAEAGDILRREITVYDTRGLVSGLVAERGGESLAVTRSYDALGRVVTETCYPDPSKSYTYTYGNRTVTTTTDGRSYIKVYDAWGNPVTSTDPASQVSYTYCSNGKPAAVTSGSVTVSMSYDQAGNRISLNDPDAGPVTSEYDPLGRLVSREDARHCSTTVEYDNLGRMSRSTTDGETTEYLYGTSGNTLHRLERVTRGAKYMRYYYDAYGRVTGLHRFLTPTQGYGFTYYYNSLGQRARVIYPDGTDVTYGFDSYGNRNSLAVAGDTLWRFVSAGPYARHERFHGSHGIVSTNDKLGNLLSRKLSSGSTVIDSLAYAYNLARGTLSSRYSLDGGTETFGYDDSDRLLSVSTGGIPLMSMSYSANGNISSKSWLGDYTYYSGRPHAVREVVNGGQAIPFNRQQVNYDSYGMATLVRTQLGDDITISYGPDQRRWLSVKADTLGHVRWERVYAGDYEQQTADTVSRRFCYLGEGVLYLSEYRPGDQGWTHRPLYILRDRQGSVTRIIDASGATVFSAYYDAWGRQTVSVNTIGFYRGYTGHEMLPEKGLINMNGRLYDPLLARFLSPDEYVQTPDLSQSLNRYSYCLNNPLGYTDPDGNFIAEVVTAAALGSLLSGASYAVSVLTTHYKDWRWRGFLKAAGMGAVSAALTAGLGQGAMALGISGKTMSFFAYKMFSQTTNAIVTDVLFRNKFSLSDLIASGVGAVVACQMPDYKAREGGALGNFLGETLYNTVIGGVTGMAQGVVKSVLKGNDKYIWQGIAGGAISGMSRTVAHNLIAGTAYTFEGRLTDGLVRKGHLAGRFLKAIRLEGLTLGRHVITTDGDISTSRHEDYHLFQIEQMGWTNFYLTWFKEYPAFHQANKDYDNMINDMPSLYDTMPFGRYVVGALPNTIEGYAYEWENFK